MCRFRKICTLERANKSDLEILQDWLESRDGGDFFLRGYEADTWHKSNEEDLVSMTCRYRDKDVFSIWIDVYIIPFFHRVLGHRLKVRRCLAFKHIHRSKRLSKSCICRTLLIWSYRIGKSSVKKILPSQLLHCTTIPTVPLMQSSTPSAQFWLLYYQPYRHPSSSSSARQSLDSAS